MNADDANMQIRIFVDSHKIRIISIMSISDKIEEIRRKPEHIRMRYVWAGVAIAMFFIIIIWLFSLEEAFKNSVPRLKEEKSIQNQLEKAKENMPSLQELMKNSAQTPSGNEISPQQSENIQENNTKDQIQQ